MRGKRSKAYRRQMDAYVRGFSFREPYQVLVDAEFVRETGKCAMVLDERVAGVLHGQVKPIITQCSIRHLYNTARTNPSAAASAAIETAKAYERRRCGHHPSAYADPVPEDECIAGVVGPANKHRYVVASQDDALRRVLRGVVGVPLVHVRRSVMILEPMARATEEFLAKGERAKFRGGLKKRKREDDDEKEKEGGEKEDGEEDGEEGEDGGEDGEGDEDDGEKTQAKPKPTRAAAPERNKKKRKYGVKGPNPLSVKKPKKRA